MVDNKQNLISSIDKLNFTAKELEKAILRLISDSSGILFSEFENINWQTKGDFNINKSIEVDISNNLSSRKNPEEIVKENRKKEEERRNELIKNPNSLGDALLGAGYKMEREFGTIFTNIQTLTYGAAISMRDNMSNFFFDAMTGKVKSFEEYFQNFVNSIKKAVSQLLSNVIMGSIEKLIFPQKASGGRVASGMPFIAGENGPELINIDGAGATVISNNTTQSMLGGANLAVEVNVINQSGTQMQASQGETRFDGQRYVVDVFLDAWARDVSGLRTAVAGRG